MGFFDNVKAAQQMMAGKSPAEIKEMIEQAKQAQAAMEEMIRKVVAEEFKKRGL
jgi:protein-arginine kinase activator protein McsA